jgi:hypothetical protein
MNKASPLQFDSLLAQANMGLTVPKSGKTIKKMVMDHYEKKKKLAVTKELKSKKAQGLIIRRMDISTKPQIHEYQCALRNRFFQHWIGTHNWFDARHQMCWASGRKVVGFCNQIGSNRRDGNRWGLSDGERGEIGGRLAHGIQLAVIDVLYQKKIKSTVISDFEEEIDDETTMAAMTITKKTFKCFVLQPKLTRNWSSTLK